MIIFKHFIYLKELNYAFKTKNFKIIGYFSLDKNLYQSVRPVVFEYVL